MSYNRVMERHLNLVKSGKTQEEKRTFPRFPFPSMTFKDQSSNIVFQVDGISPSGMGLQLKDGEHGKGPGDSIQGFIHWQGNELAVSAQVVWARGPRLGVSFQDQQSVANFLCCENIVQGLKALHLPPFDQQVPPQLKYWLKAASVLELLVWAHGNGEYQKIQILFADNFVEWRDGQGLQTGKLLGHEERDTPLFGQGEATIEMDQNIDPDKVLPLCRIIKEFPEDKIQSADKEFILMKLKAA